MITVYGIKRVKDPAIGENKSAPCSRVTEVRLVSPSTKRKLDHDSCAQGYECRSGKS
jgi:hypothetical protein